MKTLIAIANPGLRKMFFDEATVAELQHFSQVDWVEAGKPLDSVQLAAIIGGYDACITSWGSPKFTPEALAAAKRLKFIGHAAGTVAAIVGEDVFEKGITVTNANKQLARSTAEGTMAQMMAGAWKLDSYAARSRAGEWSDNNTETVLGLSGRTVGLIGYGEISRYLMGMLKGFDVRILLNSRYCTEEQAAFYGARLSDLDELLAESHIVSFHNTWTPETEGMIGSRELNLIRDGGLLVNTARAAIIQEQALIAALRERRFSAVLDVYWQEPLPVDHPLLKLDNVLCMPHIGGFHQELKQSFGRFVIRDLKRLLDGREPEGKITREIYGRLTPR